MLLPCLAGIIAIVFVIDGTNYTTVAIVVPHCGSIVFLWQILLPGLADVVAICCCVAGVIATMAITYCRTYAGHTNTLTPLVLEIIKINIFFRPGRSHVRNWQKLVLSIKILVLLKRIFDLQCMSCLGLGSAGWVPEL